ncbi:MAG: CidA/LrgA family protein [Spongiibacteraceae bacterium]
MLAGFFTLLFCQLCGELIVHALDLPLPGPVIGMFLLFAFLCIRGNVPKGVSEGSERLILLLPLLLMGPAAGVFFLGADFADQWTAFLAAVSLGTVLTLLFAGLLIRSLHRRNKNA